MKSKRKIFGASAWALFSVFTIPDPQTGQTYLKRLRIIQTPWFSIYLHWIYLPDRDRDPHDHPWNFTSIILRGGYTERVWPQVDGKRYTPQTATGDRYTDVRIIWRRFSVHRMSTDNAHMIQTLKPKTLTLIVTGRRSRVWGFWTEDGFVPFDKYIEENKTHGPDPFMS